MPNVDTRVAAISAVTALFSPLATPLLKSMMKSFIAARTRFRAVIGELRRMEDSYRKVIIAGGGHIGERLAEAIESRYQVKIIEINAARCRYLSDSLDTTVVLHGSASRPRFIGGRKY